MAYDETEGGYSETAPAGILNQAKSQHSLSIRKRAELQKKRLEEQIKNLDELIKLLDENPAIERFQNLSARTQF